MTRDEVINLSKELGIDSAIMNLLQRHANMSEEDKEKCFRHMHAEIYNQAIEDAARELYPAAFGLCPAYSLTRERDRVIQLRKLKK